MSPVAMKKMNGAVLLLGWRRFFLLLVLAFWVEEESTRPLASAALVGGKNRRKKTRLGGGSGPSDGPDDDDWWKHFVYDSEGPMSISLPPTLAPTRWETAVPTKSPTRKPTRSPTREPTRSPLRKPTKSPTGKPTKSPTHKPTKSPTRKPTSRPTRKPTGKPSSSPTSEPTSEPTIMPTPIPECIVTVSVDCETNSGTPCNELEYLTGNCLMDPPMSAIAFQYVPNTCDDSSNNQAEVAQCIDQAPFDDSDVRIECKDGDGTDMNVSPSSNRPNEVVTVTNPSGDTLPGEINCTITSVDGVKFQENLVAVANPDYTISLKERFGALVVQSCDDLTCLEQLLQDYSISNEGTGSMTITVVDRDFGGEVTDLLPFVPLNPLPPGEATSIAGITTIDLCEEQSYSFGVTVEAEPENGGKDCSADDTYKFEIIAPPSESPTQAPTNGQCDVTAVVDCKTTTGKSCKEVEYPTGSCSDGDSIDKITFRYVIGTCDASDNNQGDAAQCTDLAQFPENKNVSIKCVDVEGRGLSVSPPIVAPDQRITVTNSTGGPLPSSVNCSIARKDGVRVQNNVIGTSGFVTLNLKDKFGALTVDACNNLTCAEVLSVVYNMGNAGNSDVNITRAIASFNELDVDLLPVLPNNLLGPDESFSLTELVEIDICEEEVFVLGLYVEADPENGADCRANSTYTFEISSPPTLMPTSQPTGFCPIDISVTCRPPTGATDCRSIPQTITQCEGRPLRMGMLYNGGLCNQSFTPQQTQSGEFSCVDIGDGPPTDVEMESYIVVTALEDPSLVYHRAYVPVGSNYDLEDDGNLFVTDLNITIYSSDQIGIDTMLQTLNFQSSCSENVFINDRYGASQLVAWVNDEQGVVTCCADLVFDIIVTVPLEDTGEYLNMTSLVSATSFGIYDLTDTVYGLVFAPGESVTTNIEATIDLTVRRRYTILTTVTGQGSDGLGCRGVDFYSFIAGNSLPPSSPSLAPAPTASPTVSFSPTPDPETTPCIIAAEIRCFVTESNRPCEDLTSPTATVCVGNAPQELRFLYISGPCSQSNTTSSIFDCQDESDEPASLSAIIRVTDFNLTTVYFEREVNRGEIFVVGNGQEMTDTLYIEVFAVTEDGPGDRIQAMIIRSVCDDKSDLSLLTIYGSLQLTAFENLQLGYQSAIDAIEQSFVLRNDGKLAAIVEWANTTSTLYGDSSLVSPPGLPVAPGLEYPFVVDGTFINLYASAGQEFVNTLNVSAFGDVSDIPCEAFATLSFVVGG